MDESEETCESRVEHKFPFAATINNFLALIQASQLRRDLEMITSLEISTRKCQLKVVKRSGILVNFINPVTHYKFEGFQFF